jgi:hypothetical protein
MFVYGHPTDPIFQPPTLTFFISKIPEPGTTISGFADNKKKKIIPDRLTLDIFYK